MKWLILGMIVVSVYLMGFSKGANVGYDEAINYDPLCKIVK